MTLIEHLYELRYRLGLAILAVIGGAILGFAWFGYRVGPIPALGQLMTAPYCALPASNRVNFNGHSCALLQTQPFEAFMIRLKVAFTAGVVLSSPFWLYQVWAFITPGLYMKERRFARVFVACATVLFAGGAVLAYLVLPEALRVLSNVGANEFVTALAGDTYVSFMINLLVIFGVSFELPLLIVMLNLVGILKYEKLKKWRRGLIFAMFVFAAFVTPGQDPISMIVLAGALTALLELAIQITRVHDRKVEQRRAAEGWDGVPDDEAAPIAPAQVVSPDKRTNADRYDDTT